MYSHGLSDRTDRMTLQRDIGSSSDGSRDSSALSHTFASRSSVAPVNGDELSEITGRTSFAGVEEAMLPQEVTNGTPNQAVRIAVDPSKVPRYVT